MGEISFRFFFFLKGVKNGKMYVTFVKQQFVKLVRLVNVCGSGVSVVL